MTKDLSKLHPYTRYLCGKLIEECKRQGVNITITCTLRTKEEQDGLYAQGRIKPGPIVTNCKGGQSMHNYGVAFDIAVLNKDGKTINWSDTADTDHDGKEDYYEVGAVGKSLGLTWGGDFRTIHDMPHFEWTGGLTLADLQAGKVPPNPLVKKELTLQEAINLWAKTQLNGRPVICSPGDMLQEFNDNKLTVSRINAFMVKAACYIDKEVMGIRDAVYAWAKVGVIGSPVDMLKEFDEGNLTKERFEAFIIKSAKYIKERVVV